MAADLLRLENHTLEAMAQRRGGARLQIGALPVFGERWLMPRLGGFLAQRPDCSVHMQVFTTQVVADEPAFDLAVQYDDAPWPGARLQPLMSETCVVVCAPDSPLRAALARGDFRRTPLLQLTSRLAAWDDWFTAAGIERRPDAPASGHRFDLFSMLIEGVRASVGIGLVPHYAVERELRSGELAQAHAHLQRGPRGYSVFMAPHRPADPLAELFVDWLVELARSEADALQS